MEIRVLGCFGGELPGFRLCSFLIDGKLLIDAGAVTSVLRIPQQNQIHHIFITHSHLDHIKDLPFLAANRYGEAFQKPLLVHSIPAVIQGIQSHLFNDTLWPDFSILPSAEQPVLKFNSLEPGAEVKVEEYTIQPVSVSHSVPAVGYFVRKGKSVVLYTGDTGPTEAIWRAANQVSDLKAILIESSFPNRERNVAEKSGHLTPHLLKRELEKLNRRDIPILLVHMKPQYMRELRNEVQIGGDRNINFAEQGKRYRF